MSSSSLNFRKLAVAAEAESKELSQATWARRSLPGLVGKRPPWKMNGLYNVMMMTL